MISPTHDTTGRQILETIAKADRFNSWLFSNVQPYLNGSILEIGSGIGNISEHILNQHSETSLSDTDPEYVRLLEQRFERHPQLKGIFQIDLENSPLNQGLANLEGAFDTVISINVLEHIENDSQAIEYMKFFLKPGGTLIILTPAYPSLLSKLDKALGHFRRYSHKKISDLVKKQGMSIRRLFHFNSIGVIAWTYGKVLNLRTIPKQEMKLFNKLVPIGKFFDRMLFQKAGLSIIIIAEKSTLN